MMIYLSSILTTLVTVNVVTAQQGSLTLEYATVIHRHGDRSPVGTYPTDPYKDQWPQGYGELSYNGSLQGYQLGRLIRQRYTVEHKLLSPNYTNDEVYIRSTDLGRTLMTASSLLSALFPPDDDKKMNGTIDWQPVPVHTVLKENDGLLRASEICPHYFESLLGTTQSDYYNQVNAENQDFFEYVANATEVEYELNVYSIGGIADTVFVEIEWGLDPGSWVDDDVAENLHNLTNINFYLWFNDFAALEKQRITAGPLIGEIIDRMQTKITNETNLIPGSQVVFYSAHDVDIAAFLSAVQAFDDIQPPYASALFVELYADVNKDYFVKVWYLDQHTTEGFDLTNTTKLFIPITVNNCSFVCPLDEFISQTAEVVPDNWQVWKEECEGNLEESNSDANGLEKKDKIFIAAVTGGAVAVVVIVIMITFFIFSYRKRSQYQSLKVID